MEQMTEMTGKKEWRQGGFEMEYIEERVQGKRGRKRGMRGSRVARAAIVFLVAIGCLIPGRLFLAEVRGLSGELEILSEEEETSDVLVSGQIPLYLQKDRRWRKEKYGSDGMGVTGCGPTCLSMVLCGLRRDEKWMPVKVARMDDGGGGKVWIEGRAAAAAGRNHQGKASGGASHYLHYGAGRFYGCGAFYRAERNGRGGKYCGEGPE